MLSPIQIAEAIVEEGRTIRKISDDILVAARANAEAEYRFKSQGAIRRTQYRASNSGRKPSVDETNDAVLSDIADLLHAHLLAEAELTALRSSLSATQSRLDALRTLAASLRQAESA